MRRNQYDRYFSDHRRRMDRIMRIDIVIAVVTFGLTALLLGGGLYLIATSPETIGAWFGRAAAGFGAAR